MNFQLDNFVFWRNNDSCRIIRLDGTRNIAGPALRRLSIASMLDFLSFLSSIFLVQLPFLLLTQQNMVRNVLDLIRQLHIEKLQLSNDSLNLLNLRFIGFPFLKIMLILFLLLPYLGSLLLSLLFQLGQ